MNNNKGRSKSMLIMGNRRLNTESTRRPSATMSLDDARRCKCNGDLQSTNEKSHRSLFRLQKKDGSTRSGSSLMSKIKNRAGKMVRRKPVKVVESKRSVTAETYTTMDTDEKLESGDFSLSSMSLSESSLDEKDILEVGRKCRNKQHKKLKGSNKQNKEQQDDDEDDNNGSFGFSMDFLDAVEFAPLPVIDEEKIKGAASDSCSVDMSYISAMSYVEEDEYELAQEVQKSILMMEYSRKRFTQKQKTKKLKATRHRAAAYDDDDYNSEMLQQRQQQRNRNFHDDEKQQQQVIQKPTRIQQRNQSGGTAATQNSDVSPSYPDNMSMTTSTTITSSRTTTGKKSSTKGMPILRSLRSS